MRMMLGRGWGRRMGHFAFSQGRTVLHRRRGTRCDGLAGMGLMLQSLLMLMKMCLGLGLGLGLC